MKVTFTPRWLDSLTPGARPVDYRDLAQRGLYLRVEVSGRMTWATRYSVEGRERRIALGTYPELGLSDARAAARKHLGTVAKGDDPLAERDKRRQGRTLAEAVESWKADPKLGPAARWKGGLDGRVGYKTLRLIARLVARFGTRMLPTITTRELDLFAVEFGNGPASRNNARVAFKGFFNWAKRVGLVDVNPCLEIKKEETPEGERLLTDAELAALVQGFAPSRFGGAVHLLVLTGLRVNEAVACRWEWLDLEGAVITIPKEFEKAGKHRQGEARRVALSPQAVAVLKQQRERNMAAGQRSSPWVFPTEAGKCAHEQALKPMLNRLKGLRANGLPVSTHKLAKPRPALVPKDVSLRDIRRTVSTRLLDEPFNVAEWVIDHAILGHVRTKLKRGYMKKIPLGPAREALTRWAEHLEPIIGAAAPAGVVRRG